MKFSITTLATLATLLGSSMAVVDIGSWSSNPETPEFKPVAWIDTGDLVNGDNAAANAEAFCGTWEPISNGDNGGICNANFALSNGDGYHVDCSNGVNSDGSPSGSFGLQAESAGGGVSQGDTYTCGAASPASVWTCDDGSFMQLAQQCS